MSPTPPPSLRRRIAPIALVFIALGALFLLNNQEQATVRVVYQVAPSLRAKPTNIKRLQITEIRTTFLDGNAEAIAVMTTEFPHGVMGPVTGATPITLPPADYVARIEISARDGRTIVRRQLLHVTTETAFHEFKLK